MEQKLTLTTPLLARPGFGTLGTPIEVRANHFSVVVEDLVEERDVHHYHVLITPEVTLKKTNRDVINQLVQLYKVSHLGNRTPAYDGMHSIYTAGPLPFVSKEFVVKLGERDGRDGSSGSKRKDREFKVAVKLTNKPNIRRLQQFLNSSQHESPQEAIKALDVVLRAAPSDRCMARSFYEPILVTEFVKKHFKHRDLSKPLADDDRLKVKKALKGVKVALTCGGKGSYRITGVSAEPLSQLTFTLEENKTKTSVVDYYLQKYSKVLRNVAMPALQAGSDSKPVYLPMELCSIVAGQRYSRNLNERQVTALLRATCQRLDQRDSNIKEIVKQSKFNEDQLIKDEFGMQITEDIALVDARVLPPPLLKYHNQGRETEATPQMGQWNMINKKMVDGGKVDFWAFVNFSRLGQDFTFPFCEDLVNVCNSKGVDFRARPLFPIESASPGQIEEVLKDIHRKSTQRLGHKGKHLQLLIIILPDVTGSYGMIKRICETELGIVSQCCQPKTLSNRSKQYLETLALKINVKVGGRNTILNDAFLERIPLVTDKPTIIIGADVTHPQPGDDSSPSIAAFIPTGRGLHGLARGQYRGIVSAQAHREEIIQHLYSSYQDPEKGKVHGGMIRDGVSEGQFSQVLLYEMDAIRKACASLEELYQPLVTFVVVQKRHHTRLFPADHNRHDQMDSSGNIQPVPPAYYAHLAAFRARYYIEGNSSNVASTTAGSTSGGGGGGSVPIQAFPQIKENVKDVMFYC
ncbi:hypothetical protein ACE6H2_027532 [Prunus campanulata]